MRLVIAVAVLAIGCGNKAENATTKCAQAAQQGVDALVKRAHDRLATAQLPPDVRTKMEERTKKLDELVPRLRALLTNRCVDDKWPVAVIDCYAKITSMDELRACRSKLSPEQQAKVQKEELDLMAGAMGPPGFGSAAPPTSPEISKLEAELRQLNTQLGDATKRVADAANEADRNAAKAALQQVQAQMAALDQQLAAARAAAQAPTPTP
ncbi:MAG TPA: hypothetical protein VIV40_29365 [Kofleriaceae bacterium]